MRPRSRCSSSGISYTRCHPRISPAAPWISRKSPIPAANISSCLQRRRFEGAAPATERFEDFYKGLDISAVRLGRDVSSWQNRGTTTDPHWDGDVQDEWDEGEEPDVPDPDVPEPEEPEPYSMRAAAAPSAATSGFETGKNTTFLAREFVSANWYRLDASNGTTKESSTSFFNWDPQLEGIDALELSSDDEWVPIGRVANAGTHTGNIINEYCPLYLVGARHYHSYIRGNDGKDENGDTTPLAFMLAYTVEQKSFGRFCPEGDDGASIQDDDGIQTEAFVAVSVPRRPVRAVLEGLRRDCAP